jgi:hypothetical protein
MRRSWTPSIVPTDHDQTIYLVVNNFGHLGTAFTETDIEQHDLETGITDLMSGQSPRKSRTGEYGSSHRYWQRDRIPGRSLRGQGAPSLGHPGGLVTSYRPNARSTGCRSSTAEGRLDAEDE